jgi:hypothetical protein
LVVYGHAYNSKLKTQNRPARVACVPASFALHLFLSLEF